MPVPTSENQGGNAQGGENQGQNGNTDSDKENKQPRRRKLIN
jgi:hypothetical protein